MIESAILILIGFIFILFAVALRIQHGDIKSLMVRLGEMDENNILLKELVCEVEERVDGILPAGDGGKMARRVDALHSKHLKRK